MRISLCVVARNEAAFIGETIASAQPIVDEAVVVDTGSTDATPDIARDAGAKVVHAPWPGDLGSAHDLPVAHASGDWVLALDGDEALDPSSRDRIRDLAAAGEHDGYRVLIRNYSYTWDAKWRPADPCDPLTRGAAGYIPTWPVRLFRRRAEYRYSGLLHQCVGPAIRRNGGRVGAADATIHHYGFLRFDRAKSPMYRELTARQVQAHPDDSRAWVELGVVLLGEEGLAGLPAAAQAFRQAWSLGDCADAAFLLGSALVDLGHPQAAVSHLAESIRANPHDAAGHYDRADAWEALGLAYEDLGWCDDAAAAYREAIASRPDSPAATHNLAALLIETGEIKGAARLLDELMTRHRGSAACWSLLGRIRLRQADPDAAATAFRTALDIRPESLGARVNLAVAYRRAGRPHKAARAYTAAAEQLGSPEAERLGLGTRLPPQYRRRPARKLDDLGPGLVVSLTGSLAGGSGRVLADGVAALAGRPQLVLCEDACTYNGQGLRAEIEAAGVPVLTITSHAEVLLILRRVRPAVVIHHWYPMLVPGALRAAAERWICVGHAALPMPRGYDAYVVNSEFNRQYQDHLPPDRIRFIPNGVAMEQVEKTERALDAPVTIAMLSRLDVGKFPRRLLDQLPRMDGARMLIGGYGARRHEIEPEIAARGLQDCVHFVGPVSGSDVAGFLAGADIGLHLTETHQELCSMSVLQMLAAGLPVVAESKGGLPEMVTDGHNGFLAKTDEEVAGRLRELIESPTMRARMADASRAVARRFDIAAFDSSLRELVRTVERGDADSVRADRGGDRPSAATPAPRPVGRGPRLSYLVCATARSGSSLLCEALAGSGLAGHPSELFAATTRSLLGGLSDTPDLPDYIAELLRRLATPNGVFGAKVKLDDLEVLLEGLRDEGGALGRSAHDVLAAAFPGLRCVWITRRDKVRQAVSWERAVQTDVWEHTGARPPITLPRPRFDAASIRQRLDAIDREEQSWVALFAEAGFPPVEVVYEDLVDDYVGTTQRVLAELGVHVPQPLWLAPARLRRQADARSERWVQRFREQQQHRRDRAGR